MFYKVLAAKKAVKQQKFGDKKSGEFATNNACVEQTDEIRQNKRRLCANHKIINLNGKDYGA